MTNSGRQTPTSTQQTTVVYTGNKGQGVPETPRNTENDVYAAITRTKPPRPTNPKPGANKIPVTPDVGYGSGNEEGIHGTFVGGRLVADTRQRLNGMSMEALAAEKFAGAAFKASIASKADGTPPPPRRDLKNKGLS